MSVKTTKRTSILGGNEPEGFLAMLQRILGRFFKSFLQAPASENQKEAQKKLGALSKVHQTLAKEAKSAYEVNFTKGVAIEAQAESIKQLLDVAKEKGLNGVSPDELSAITDKCARKIESAITEKLNGDDAEANRKDYRNLDKTVLEQAHLEARNISAQALEDSGLSGPEQKALLSLCEETSGKALASFAKPPRTHDESLGVDAVNDPDLNKTPGAAPEKANEAQSPEKSASEAEEPESESSMNQP